MQCIHTEMQYVEILFCNFCSHFLFILLCSYASINSSVVANLDSIQAFQKMRRTASTAVAEHPDMSASDLTAMFSGLMSFAAIVYPSRLDYIDDVLKSVAEVS